MSEINREYITQLHLNKENNPEHSADIQHKETPKKKGGGIVKRIARKAVLGTALVSGALTTQEVGKAQVADVGGQIVFDKMRSNTEIERMKAMEYTRAIYALSNLLKNTVQNGVQFSNTLVDKSRERGYLKPRDYSQLEDVVEIVQNANEAMAQITKGSRPVLDDEKYGNKKERILTGGAIAGAAVSEIFGKRGNRRVEEYSRTAGDIVGGMIRHRTENEGTDRQAGSEALLEATSTLAVVGNFTEEICKILGEIKKDDRVEDIVSELREEQSIISRFAKEMTTSVTRERGKR